MHRTGRQDEETKEEMTTTTQASTTTTKATMVEETNEVNDPMEQCDKCRKAAYTYKKKFFLFSLFVQVHKPLKVF